MADKGVAGYIAGGTTVDKFAFPSDTRSTLATGLSTSRTSLAGVADSTVAGYFGGGSGPSAVVDKFAFPSDTRTTLGTGLSAARTFVSGFSDEAI
jgi:hypothetical protein